MALIGNLSAPIQLLEGLARAGGAAFDSYRVTTDDLRALVLGVQRIAAGEASRPLLITGIGARVLFPIP